MQNDQRTTGREEQSIDKRQAGASWRRNEEERGEAEEAAGPSK
jgi:hypothetical protein